MAQTKIGWRPYVSGTDADAQAFITAAGITDSTQQSAINTLVTQLKTYGIWTKMKALYPMVGGTATSHKWNLKDPRDLDAAYRLVFNGGWVHSSTGALPNGLNTFADTKLTPSSTFNTTTFNHLSYYSRTSLGSQGYSYDMGSYDFNNGGHNAMIIRRLSNVSDFGASYPSNTSYSNASPTTVTDGSGLFLGTQNGTSIKYFKNTSVIATNTGLSTNSPQAVYAPIFIGTLGEYGYATTNRWSNKECAFVSIGTSLSDAEAANFYTAVQTYQSTLGRNVGTPIVADADAQAFLNAAAITDLGQANAVNTLVTDLKAANIWTKMRALYPFVGGSATSHKFNLKDPRDLDAAYRLVFNGGWTHSSTGALPNGTTGYASLGSLNMNTIDPINYSLGAYTRTDASLANFYDFGATNNVDTGWFLMNTRTGTNNVNYQAGSINIVSSNANSQGFYQASSNSAALTTVFKNSTTLTTSTTTQTKTPFNQIFEIGRGTITTGGGYYSTRNQAAFYISTYLDNTEKTAFYTAIQKYQTSLGRQV